MQRGPLEKKTLVEFPSDNQPGKKHRRRKDVSIPTIQRKQQSPAPVLRILKQTSAPPVESTTKLTPSINRPHETANLRRESPPLTPRQVYERIKANIDKTFIYKPLDIRPCTMIDQSLHFQLEKLAKSLRESPTRMIISVLGRQGVGKTTLLNHLMDDTFVFKKQMKSTFSIDVYMSPERVIYIDTMPLLSRDVFEQYKKNNAERDIKHRIKSSEEWIRKFSVELISFILSISHTVITVSNDQTKDAELFSLVREAENQTFPNCTGNSEKTDIFIPTYIHVLNNQTGSAILPIEYSESCISFTHHFNASKLPHRNSISLSSLYEMYKSVKDATHDVNLFILPRVLEKDGVLDEYSSCIGCPGRFSILIKELWEMIMDIPRYITIKSSDKEIHVKKKAFLVTEKEWIMSAEAIWSDLRRDRTYAS